MPLEDAVAAASRVKRLTAQSLDGVSLVSVEFWAGTEADLALQDCQRRVNEVLSTLPVGAKMPLLAKYSLADLPILRLAVTSRRPALALGDLLRDRLRPRLAQLPGVGQVTLVGEAVRAVEVNLRARRLAELRVPVAQVVAALQAANLNVPAGTSMPAMPASRCGCWAKAPTCPACAGWWCKPPPRAARFSWAKWPTWPKAARMPPTSTASTERPRPRRGGAGRRPHRRRAAGHSGYRRRAGKRPGPPPRAGRAARPRKASPLRPQYSGSGPDAAHCPHRLRRPEGAARRPAGAAAGAPGRRRPRPHRPAGPPTRAQRPGPAAGRAAAGPRHPRRGPRRAGAPGPRQLRHRVCPARGPAGGRRGRRAARHRGPPAPAGQHPAHLRRRFGAARRCLRAAGRGVWGRRAADVSHNGGLV